MQLENLLLEVKEGIALLTINREKAMNTLSIATVDDLHRAFYQLGRDDNVKAVILTGAGSRAFAAGADISELNKLGLESGLHYAKRGQKMLDIIEDLGKLVIAAINGFALGGGCELAMACTIRIASENAKMGQPEVNLGIIPGFGGTQRLPRIVGKGRAMELILTGRVVDADEALRIGLVSQVHPQDKLLEGASELAKTILSKGPVAVKLCLEAVNRGLDMTLDEGLNLEANLFGIVCSTEDETEGTAAFMEKRKPVFKGR